MVGGGRAVRTPLSAGAPLHAESAPAWAGYEAAEDAFFAVDQPEPRADLVVDGAPTVPHDPSLEYVRLR